MTISCGTNTRTVTGWANPPIGQPLGTITIMIKLWAETETKCLVNIQTEKYNEELKGHVWTTTIYRFLWFRILISVNQNEYRVK